MKQLLNLRSACHRFVRDDAGEVTIAWVLITSAGVSLAIAVMTSVGGGTQEYSEKVDTELSDREVTETY